MLGVFSRVRFNLFKGEGFPRYLRYAIGEILLITFGILIALRIDTWNEERIEQQQIHSYARALIEDLKADLVMIEPIFHQVSAIESEVERMAGYLQGRSIEEIDNLELIFIASRKSYRPYNWNRTALEQLKGSGSLRQMRDQSLVARISAYEAFSRHLDEDFLADMSAGKAAASEIRNVVDSNIPGLDAIENAIAEAGPQSLDELLAFIDEQAAGMDRGSLITDDIRDVKRMLNAFTDFSRSVNARHRIEIPKLQAMARELIALLEAEYPQ